MVTTFVRQVNTEEEEYELELPEGVPYNKSCAMFERLDICTEATLSGCSCKSAAPGPNARYADMNVAFFSPPLTHQ